MREESQSIASFQMLTNMTDTMKFKNNMRFSSVNSATHLQNSFSHNFRLHALGSPLKTRAWQLPCVCTNCLCLYRLSFFRSLSSSAFLFPVQEDSFSSSSVVIFLLSLFLYAEMFHHCDYRIFIFLFQFFYFWLGGLSSWAQLHCGMWGLSCLTRDQTCAPCIGRQIPAGAPGKAPQSLYLLGDRMRAFDILKH